MIACNSPAEVPIGTYAVAIDSAPKIDADQNSRERRRPQRKTEETRQDYRVAKKRARERDIEGKEEAIISETSFLYSCLSQISDELQAVITCSSMLPPLAAMIRSRPRHPSNTRVYTGWDKSLETPL